MLPSDQYDTAITLVPLTSIPGGTGNCWQVPVRLNRKDTGPASRATHFELWSKVANPFRNHPAIYPALRTEGTHFIGVDHVE